MRTLDLEPVDLDLLAEPSRVPASLAEADDDRWLFCVGCAIAVPASALHQHLRVCSGTTSA